MTKAQMLQTLGVVAWIVSGLCLVQIAFRMRERAKYGPGRQAFLAAEESIDPIVERAAAQLRDAIPPLTAEQHDANWRAIEKRCVPELYAYTAANPLVTEDGLATWVNDPDAEFCPVVLP